MLIDSRNNKNILNSKLYKRIENVSNRSLLIHWQTNLMNLQINLIKKYLYLHKTACMAQKLFLILL